MRTRDAVGVMTAIALIVGAGGYVAADAADVVPGVLTFTSPDQTPSPFPTPAARAASPAATAGQAPAADAPKPTRKKLAELASSVFAGKDRPGLGKVGISVVDLASGEKLLESGANTARTPASTTKAFTAAAAIETLGPSARATTTVVSGKAPDQIVLVGGGDAMLAAGRGDPSAVLGRAGLGDLAAATASALKDKGITTVRLQLDDTMFTGPAIAPTWKPSMVPDGQAAPIAPLMVDIGKVHADKPIPRQADPAMAAAIQFAKQLRKNKVGVATSIGRAAAPAGASQLAAVQSAPFSEVVGYMLQHSDNTVAEVLGRLVAKASGKPASFKGAAQSVRDVAAALGVDATGVGIVDCSGLSYSSKVKPAALTQLFAAVYASPELRSVVAGLPIAALDGTLGHRFGAQDTDDAAGAIRAKTGTLNGVNALAGIAQDADGRALAFAALLDVGDVKGPVKYSGEHLLDAFGAGLVDCGCR